MIARPHPSSVCRIRAHLGRAAVCAGALLLAVVVEPVVPAAAQQMMITRTPGPSGPSMRPPAMRPPAMRPPEMRPPAIRPPSFEPRRPRPHWGGPGIVIAVPPPPPPVEILPDDPPPRRAARRPPPPARTATSRPPQRRPGFVVPAASERRFRPNEVILDIAADVPEAELVSLARRNRLTRLQSQEFPLTGRKLFRWRIDDGRSVAAVIRALQREARIGAAQPNYVYALQEQAALPSAAAAAPPEAQYTLAKLRVPEAHQVARGDSVLVAVIDSGIDASHPDLDGVVAESFDAVDDDKPHAHGTGMAGAIAAHGRVMGVAPAVKLLAVRAFSPTKKSADGTTFDILRGLDWAVSKGARVVNMSFAGPPDAMLARALAAARKKGVVLIAAAGNAGPKAPPLYPAADDNVIAVTATDVDDKVFARANRGTHLTVAAPGVDILVPAPGAGYQISSGTSVAAAHVSGIAALLIEANRDLDPDGARRLLTATARDLGKKGRDTDYGFGLADAYGALLATEEKTAGR